MNLLEVAKIYVKSQLRLWLASSAVTRLNVSYRWINHLQRELYIGITGSIPCGCIECIIASVPPAPSTP